MAATGHDHIVPGGSPALAPKVRFKTEDETLAACPEGKVAAADQLIESRLPRVSGKCHGFESYKFESQTAYEQLSSLEGLE